MGKPNILLITCDELRQDALSCYGNKAVDTPWIDSIAAQGIRFDQAYTVSPWCLPARCAILTGLYPHRSGAYSNFRKCPLDQGLPNLFTQLKKTGYKTNLIGKCHFAPVPYSQTVPDKTLPYDEFKQYYESLGIDHLVLQDDKQVSAWFYDDYSKDLERHQLLKAYRDLVWDKSKAKLFPFPGPDELHPDAWVGSQANSFLKSIKDDTPTFTWVSFSGPHYPYDAPESYHSRVKIDQIKTRNMRPGELDTSDRILHKSYHGAGNIDGCGVASDHACKNFTEEYWRELQISYFANIALIDDKVGDILQTFRSSFGDDMVIIFTADHGEMLGNHGVWGKHNCAYNDVWKIPFLAEMHSFSIDNTRHGSTSEMVNLLDILPTILSFADADQIKCDGRNLIDQIAEGGYQYIFAEGEGFLAVTDGRYKYVHIQKPGENYQELLDSKEDPEESYNLIREASYAPDLARLRGHLIEHIMADILP